jgi:hypothetical protein
MSARALAVMAWSKMRASSGWACRYAQNPSRSVFSTAGAPVRTEVSRPAKLDQITGSPIMRANARMDIRWSSRSSREASVCR